MEQSYYKCYLIHLNNVLKPHNTLEIVVWAKERNTKSLWGFKFDLKNVKINDQIIYNYKEIKNIYYIDTIEIIRSTDWSYLENTEENKITLITCVENEPNYRRCVQASQIE